MWPSELDEFREETLAINAVVEEAMIAAPPVEEVGAPAVRAAREAGEGVFGPVVHVDHAEDRVIDGVPVRQIVPDDVAGVYLHIHGGGWTLGSADAQDPALDRIATAAKVAVVSVDYPLAPEHPYPAGPDACEAAAVWVLDHMAEEYGTSTMVIGGESAGAHLSAVTLLRLRDRHDALGAVAAVNLVYGCYDLVGTPSLRSWDRQLILTPGNLAWFFDNFLEDRSPAARQDPDISPLYADLSNLPPALFSVGTADPLLDDSLFMHARWIAAGNDAELAVYPDAMHAFDGFPSAMTTAFEVRTDAFIAAAVG